MHTNRAPTQRQLRWYGTPYKPSQEQSRKDIDEYLRWRGIIRDEPTFDDGA